MKRYVLLLLLFLPGLNACEKIDLRGMFKAYESVNTRFEASMDWNSRNPDRNIDIDDDDYLLFVMADSHVGGTENLLKFFDRALEADALAAVMAGDLTTGRRTGYTHFERSLPDPEQIALFPMVGNHDLYFNGWEEYFTRLGSSTYLFTIETPVATDLFICLDTGSGTLGNRQLDWLRDILSEKRPDYRHCIIFTHNNFFRPRFTSSTNPNVEELHVLTELFTLHNVDMLITGHDHKKSDHVLGNTRYLTLDALLDGYRNAGYLKLQSKEGELVYTFVNF
ncbi:MAG: metallophosphoesterase [Bacteroidales bacterium]|nr:metallophosphoesterase [Bacteroidales bacterium]